jgi:hypothetical protein
VSPHVRYGMTFLLIRDTIGIVYCSVAWGRAQYLAWDPHGAIGARAGEYESASRPPSRFWMTDDKQLEI